MLNSFEHFLPLHLCIQKGALHVAKVLIEDGEDLETKNSFGQTPLHLASMKGLTNIVKVLLENGANVNSVERNGFSPSAIAWRKFKHYAQLFWPTNSFGCQTELYEHCQNTCSKWIYN